MHARSKLKLLTVYTSSHKSCRQLISSLFDNLFWLELPSFSRHSAVAFTSTTSSSQSSATTTVTSTGEEGTHSQPSSSRDRPDLGVGSGADDPAQRLLPTSGVHSLNMSFVVDNDADFSSSEDESSWDFSSGDDLSSESNY